MSILIRYAARVTLLVALFLLTNTTAQAEETAPFNRAQVVSVQVPNIMTAGETYTVRITLRNVGTKLWQRADNHYGHKLGSECPRDNRTWGTNRIYMPEGKIVYPGQFFTFVFDVTAPATPGQHCFQWKMVEEAVEWFDHATAPKQIRVLAPLNRATFVSQQVPAQIRPGETEQVKITMKNTGTSTWTRRNNVFGHKLGSQCPQDNTLWGTNRVKLPPGTEVKPGQTHTFVFDITGPAAYGHKCFQWQMVEEGVRWFLDPTPVKLIFVSNTASAQSR